MKQFTINVPETIPVASLVDFISFAVHNYREYLYYSDLNEFGQEKADENLKINDDLTQLVMDAVHTNEEWLTASDLSIKFFDSQINLKEDDKKRVDAFLNARKAYLDLADEYEYTALQIQKRIEIS